MERQIIELIEEEVKRRVELEVTTKLAAISRLYEIPIMRLIKDTLGVECKFCRGILKSKKRCLKEPRENGYCGFHQKQAPDAKTETEEPEPEPPVAPWD